MLDCWQLQSCGTFLLTRYCGCAILNPQMQTIAFVIHMKRWNISVRNIGVIYLGHKDYLCENTFAIQRAAYSCMKDIPFVNASVDAVLTSETEAVNGVRKLLANDCCGALIILNTWVECNVVMSALKELRGLPCMFWGFPLDETEGRRESTGSYVSASMFSGVIRRIGLNCPTLFASWKDPSAPVQMERFARVCSAMDAAPLCNDPGWKATGCAQREIRRKALLSGWQRAEPEGGGSDAIA